MFSRSQFLTFSLPFSISPLAGVILGILFPQLFFLVLFFFVPIFLIFLCSKKTIFSFKVLCLFFGGFLLASGRTLILNNNYLHAQPLFSTNQTVCLTDIIKTGNFHWPYRLTLKKTKSPYFSFFLYTKKRPLANISDQLLLSACKIKQPKDNDFQLYLLKEGVSGTSFVQDFKPKVIHTSTFSFSKWAYKKKETLLSSLKKKMSKPAFSFFCSLFIGDKKQINYLTEKYKPLFKTWGISHHLARSGLHLIVFIFLWQLILSLLPFSFFKKQILLFSLCFFYFCITPSSISFNRAFFLLVFYNLCALCSWQIHTVHLLSLIAIGVLIYNPFQLFFLDFQLSFFLTFCLAWLSSLKQQKKSCSK